MLGTATELALVGRALERNALEQWLDAVVAGQASLALLEGEAGIGKTRLADSARAAAVGRSFEVFSGSADELDHGRPFGLLVDALGVALPPGEAASVVPGLEFRAVDLLVEQVEASALKGPVAIVLEDLQWADPGTVVGLRAVSRRLAHLPLALLGTFRPWPRSRELERLIEAWRADAAVHLVLAPLGHAEVFELASALLSAQPDSELEHQLASAAGNPLFVRELVGALSEEGAIEFLDGRARLAERSLPPSLRLTILRRIGLLGDATASLLRSASLLGTRFSLTDLATLSGRSATELVDEMLEARRAGVVEESGPLLRFRHALVRDAVYSDVPESMRRALHRDAGERLAAAGAPASQVAEQLSLGATPGDAGAVRWLSQTARESVLRAPQTAVELFERAVDLAVGGGVRATSCWPSSRTRWCGQDSRIRGRRWAPSCSHAVGRPEHASGSVGPSCEGCRWRGAGGSCCMRSTAGLARRSSPTRSGRRCSPTRRWRACSAAIPDGPSHLRWRRSRSARRSGTTRSCSEPCMR